MKSTVEVTETNFETEVLKSNRPVLVGFATGWSLSSMTLDGVLQEIAR
jgi:thioredoxin-like negative regulator of GroEL